MCNWIPGSLAQGESKTVECVTDDANGRYVSLSMTGTVYIYMECITDDGNACYVSLSMTGKVYIYIYSASHMTYVGTIIQ